VLQATAIPALPLKQDSWYCSQRCRWGRGAKDQQNGRENYFKWKNLFSALNSF